MLTIADLEKGMYKIQNLKKIPVYSYSHGFQLIYFKPYFTFIVFIQVNLNGI